MKKLLCVCAFVMASGCTTVYWETVALAEEACKKNGGMDVMKYKPKKRVVYCKNNAVFTVKPETF